MCSLSTRRTSQLRCTSTTPPRTRCCGRRCSTGSACTSSRCSGCKQQHEQIGEYLERIQSLLPVWSETAGPDERNELATTFADASAVLEKHLDEEER